MLIGEVAERSGVPAKTLRYYEDIGVLRAPARSPSGYRDYGGATLDRLGFISAAKAAGLTLAEIRDVISLRDDGVAPCSHVAALLDQKADAVTRHIDELQTLLKELNRLRRRARRFHPAACDPRRVCDVLLDGPTGG
jgi:DNA-binding transcriptional MerR regulator